METVNDKKFTINMLRWGNKKDRDKVLQELFDIEEKKSDLSLSKFELLTILQYCFYTHDKDSKQLFRVMKRINPNIKQSDLILRFNNPKPLLEIFRQEKRRRNLVV